MAWWYELDTSGPGLSSWTGRQYPIVSHHGSKLSALYQLIVEDGIIEGGEEKNEPTGLG